MKNSLKHEMVRETRDRNEVARFFGAACLHVYRDGMENSLKHEMVRETRDRNEVARFFGAACLHVYGDGMENSLKHEMVRETRDRNIIYITDDLLQLRSRGFSREQIKCIMNKRLSVNLNGIVNVGHSGEKVSAVKHHVHPFCLLLGTYVT